MQKCMNMTQEECAAYCDSMMCTSEQKELCKKHAIGGECHKDAANTEDPKCEGDEACKSKCKKD
jgi:hypothetical protein